MYFEDASDNRSVGKNKLSSEQREKRKARLGRAIHAMLWLHPSTQIQMAGKVIRNKVNQRRGSNKSKPLNESTESIIDGIQKAMAMAIAKSAGLSAGEAKPKIVASDDPMGMALGLIAKSSNQSSSVDSVAETLANSAKGVRVDEIDIDSEISSADGDSASDMQLIFSKAKMQAKNLPESERGEAISAIVDLQQAISKNISNAKSAIGKADKKDVAEVKSALGKTSINALAETVSDTKAPAEIGNASSEEKSALGSGGSFLSNNKNLLMGLALVGLAYYFYTRNSTAPQAATGGAVGAVAGAAPTM